MFGAVWGVLSAASAERLKVAEALEISTLENITDSNREAQCKSATQDSYLLKSVVQFYRMPE